MREQEAANEEGSKFWPSSGSQLTEISILTTGGQNIDDIFKYLPSTSRLAMAKRTLEWRHIAPTAPDTLCELNYPRLTRSSCKRASKSSHIRDIPLSGPRPVHPQVPARHIHCR